MNPLRVGINGFGRVGRAVFRIAHQRRAFSVVAINDINPDPANLAYLLSYDSTYGRFGEDVCVCDGHLEVAGNRVAMYRANAIDEVTWEAQGVDIVVDASGVQRNVLQAPGAIRGSVRKVVVTHSPAEVDATIVLGVNEEEYDPARHHVIAASICDANALAPVAKVLDRAFGISHGFLTTLHPWLSYQNVVDGPSRSQAFPGQVYHHYALGRASLDSLIPKPTTAIEATRRVLPNLSQEFLCFSYRVPTAIVTSGDLSLALSRPAKVEDVIASLEEYEKGQAWRILHNSVEPLVSIDFCRSEYSATVDHRWTMVANGRLLKIVLWYDNEWGYGHRVVDLVQFIGARGR